ncbi:MAG: hypothetical protein IIA72_07255 [Proteobacteria bacterium]|nr:hypothetical protein [Pseudomonadota bacterium]
MKSKINKKPYAVLIGIIAKQGFYLPLPNEETSKHTDNVYFADILEQVRIELESENDIKIKVKYLCISC